MNQPINPYEFQKQINRYAKDIAILWNSTIERYQIFQLQRPLEGFVLPTNTPRKDKIRPMFTVQTDNGDYRDPDNSDLDRIIASVNRTIDLQIKGFDFTSDMMEKDDIAREESVAPGATDAMEWAAKEIFKARVRKGIGAL